MKKKRLTEQQKHRITALVIVFLGIAVLLGQIVEAKPVFLGRIPNLRMFIDPIQYMIGMLIINFILVITAIKKYEKYPNPFLNTLKWYFAILLVNDFFMMVFKVIQKSNFIAIQSSATIGVGQTYMVLASVKGIVDLTLTSAAMLLFVHGLSRYVPCGESPKTFGDRIIKVMMGLVLVQYLFSIPVNLSGFINNRTVFAWSLGFSQTGHLALIALIYWIVKEYQERYHTRFFRYLTWYYMISLGIAGLVYTYSMGTLGLLQRVPAGEIGLIGWFGQFVFYVSHLCRILLNYLIYISIAEYAEPPKRNDAEQWTKDVPASASEGRVL